MNILKDKLKSTIDVDGITYKVNPSFSLYIKINLLLDNVAINDEKLLEFLGEFCKDFTVTTINIEHFIKKIMEFYNAGAEHLNYIENFNVDNVKIIDFEMDKNTIFADFMREYKINLQREDLHIYEFLALLSGLSAESMIKQRIYYRTVKINKLKGDERTRIEEMKQLYKIGKKNEIEMAKNWIYEEDRRISELKKMRC